MAKTARNPSIYNMMEKMASLFLLGSIYTFLFSKSASIFVYSADFAKSFFMIS